MPRPASDESELDQRVIGCAIKVHRTLGPGFHEIIYQNALVVAFRKDGVDFETEKGPTDY